jgi:hypothetical protein
VRVSTAKVLIINFFGIMENPYKSITAK